MAVLKKSIPVVAGASLVLGGGCGGDADSLAARICRTQQSCDPDYFAEEWERRSDCVDYAAASIDLSLANLRRRYGDDCADAQVELNRCIVSNFERTCDVYSYSECEREYNMFYNICYD